jgi:hypothetical protein
MKIPAMLFRIAATLTCLGVFGACVSTRHQLVADVRAVPGPMETLAEGGQEVRVILRQLIVPRGPGSWKSQADWDEYVLELHSSALEVRQVIAARLIAADGREIEPGRTWKAVENAARVQTSGARVGEAVAAGGRGVIAGAAGGGGLVLSHAVMSHELALAARLFPVVLVPLAVAAVTTAPDAMAAGKLDREFARRNLFLPARVPPGAGSSRSLFFPPTPGAAALLLTLRGPEGMETVTLDLTAVKDVLRPPLP